MSLGELPGLQKRCKGHVSDGAGCEETTGPRRFTGQNYPQTWKGSERKKSPVNENDLLTGKGFQEGAF